MEVRDEDMKKKQRALDGYRILYIHRPNTPQIERFIDREFQVIYINTAAAPGAKIVWLQ